MSMSPQPDDSVVVQETGNGPYAQVVTTGHHLLGADEPERLGGRDSGPSPYQFLMAGLGACTTITLRMYAMRHNWPLEMTSVLVSHRKAVAEGGKPSSDTFERKIYLTGDLSDEQRRRLLEIADRCPVSETLRRASTVVSELAPADSPLRDNFAHVAHS
jgi:putative redox protein